MEQKPFYKKIWFIGLCVVVIIGIIAGGSKKSSSTNENGYYQDSAIYKKYPTADDAIYDFFDIYAHSRKSEMDGKIVEMTCKFQSSIFPLEFNEKNIESLKKGEIEYEVNTSDEIGFKKYNIDAINNNVILKCHLHFSKKVIDSIIAKNPKFYVSNSKDGQLITFVGKVEETKWDPSINTSTKEKLNLYNVSLVNCRIIN